MEEVQENLVRSKMIITKPFIECKIQKPIYSQNLAIK